MRSLATAHGPSTAEAATPSSARRALLVCGIASSLLFVAMNVFIPMLWANYSWTSQTVSELSAIDAPTRPLWVALGLVYTLLVIAFGAGVWSSARRNPPLRVAGAQMIVSGVLGLAWPPMHQRVVLAAGGGTLTDTLHIVWTMMWGLLAFGALTSVDGPRVSADLPTPWMGVWERANIASYLLWVVVLAVTLLRGRPRTARWCAASTSARGVGSPHG